MRRDSMLFQRPFQLSMAYKLYDASGLLHFSPLADGLGSGGARNCVFAVILDRALSPKNMFDLHHGPSSKMYSYVVARSAEVGGDLRLTGCGGIGSTSRARDGKECAGPSVFECAPCSLRCPSMSR